MQSWQINNSHKRSVKVHRVLSALKTTTMNRNPMAMAASTSAKANKSAKSTGKSALMTHLTRSVPNFKNLKRETSNSIDMIYNANDEKPWSCKMCKRQYKWKNSLNCHIKNECGKPPKFFCERMCGYKTNINSNMKRHMNSNCKPRFMQ